MIAYTPKQLRTNLKDALDAAEQGDIVTITRRGRVFILVDPEIDDFASIVGNKISKKELGL